MALARYLGVKKEQTPPPQSVYVDATLTNTRSDPYPSPHPGMEHRTSHYSHFSPFLTTLQGQGMASPGLG